MIRTLAFAFILIATPALADIVPIDGVFGNASGCRFYTTGEIKGDIMVLTPDTMSSPEAQCQFLKLTATTTKTFTLDAVCSGSGDFKAHPDKVVIEEFGAAGYLATVEGLPQLGPFIPCANFDGVEV